MKYKCIKTDSCKVCKRKGTIQVFLNQANLVKYARTRHYNKGKFTYCKLENLAEVTQLLESKANSDQKQSGQTQTWSTNLYKSSFKSELVAGPLGFEPRTFSLEGPHNIDLKQYREYLDGQYSKQYASLVYGYTLKYSAILDNPQKLRELPASIRCNVLKSIVALSKYIGCYEDFKAKIKQYGIHWSNGDNSFKAFLKITNNTHSTLGKWYRDATKILRPNERLYLKFTLLTGLRKNEALTAFNMIIDLSSQHKLSEFYNRDIQALEFYKYPQFNRRTKKVFISFVPKDIVNEIAASQSVSYYAIRRRLTSKKLPVRIKELRSYFTTYLRQNGVLPETVNLLQGRIDARDIQLVHYFKIADMQQLSKQILDVTKKLKNKLAK